MRFIGTKTASLDELATEKELGTAVVNPAEPVGYPEGHLWYDTDEADDVSGAAAKTTKINAGSGLTGGGDLSADRTLAVDFTDPRLSMSPIGVIQMWPGDTAPANHLLLDGTVYNIADYPVLGPILGSKYGGNGTTTFGVPDCRGQFVLGVNGSHPLGSKGGAERVTLSTSEMPSHTHPLPGHTFNWGVNTGIYVQNAIAAAGAPPSNNLNTAQGSWNYSNASGGGASHENMPPFIALNYIIRAL